MKFLFLLLFFPFCLAAQQTPASVKQITGLWKGYVTTTDVKVPYEIVFSEQNGKLTGWSYTSFTVRGEKIVSMKKLTVSFAGGVITEDDDNVYNNFPQEQLKKIKQINTLTFEEGPASSKLTGTFETSTPRSLKHAKGTVFLKKKNTSDSSMLIAKLDEMDLTRTLSFSFNAPPVKERAGASVAMNENPVPEKIIASSVSAKIPDIDTAEPFNAVVLKKSVPVSVALISSGPAKSILPSVRTKQAPPVVMAPIKSAAMTVPEKSIAKTTPRVIPPRPRSDAIVAKALPAPLPVAKAKIMVPVVKKIPPAFAPVKVASKNLPDNIAVAPTIDLGKRKIEIIDQLSISADSLQFTLYDNGDVDGDTVSIIMNGKTIVSRQGLSTTPFTKTLYLTPAMGDSVQLIMYAENLGAIAPNTGLMILNFDKQRREVRFSGDLSKNAAITLRRKRKE